MLEAALEQLLLRYLAPYVDGISKDKLHVGVFRGSLELKGLTIKPDALALLGWEGLEVRQGSIGLIKLSVPWSSLYTGKLRAVVRSVHLEIDQLSDCCSTDTDEATLVAKVREAKRKAIDLRVVQLRDLLEQQREQLEAIDGNNQRGYAVKLFRKILNNIHIALTDVRASFINRRRGLAVGLELPTLEVLSTDEAFREPADGEEVVVSGLSMYKLLRLRGLGVRMSAAGSSELGGAEYVLTPISASLQMAHVPSDQVLRLRLLVATEEIAELAFRRSQVKHLRSVQQALATEAVRLHELLVPPADDKAIYSNAEASKVEYAGLFERSLLHELRLAGSSHKPLSPAEVERLRLLEDALSVRFLARQQWLVRNKVEALGEAVARITAEKARLNGQGLRRSSTTSLSSGSKAEDGSGSFLTAEDRDQLLAAINDETKVETVDLPQRLKFEFVLGKMVVDLVDDRWAEEVRKQLLSVSLQEATWLVDVNLATDHTGRDSAEWRVESCLGAFRALHAGRSLVRISPMAPLAIPRIVSDVSGLSLGSRSVASPTTQQPSVCQQASEALTSAATLVIESKVEPEQNLLRLHFNFAPVDAHLLPGALEQLLEFLRSPTPVAACSTTFPNGEDCFSAKDLLPPRGERAVAVVEQVVYEHIPDKFHLEVHMESPVVHVPVVGYGSSTVSLGRLDLVTPTACSYNDISLDVALDRATLHGVSSRGEQLKMVQPIPVDLSIRYQGFDDEMSFDVQAKTKEVKLSLTPEALGILLATPGAVASLMYVVESSERSSQEPLAKEAVLQADAESSVPLSTEDDDEEEEEVFRLRLNLTVEIDSLDVALEHARESVMQVHLSLPAPGVVLYQQTTPPVLLVDVERGGVEVTILNPLRGEWDSLLQRVDFALQVVRRPERVEESATHVKVNSLDPVLINLTPSCLQRAVTVLPSFLSCFIADPAAEGDGPQQQSSTDASIGTKYRVVNLCDSAFELELHTLHGRSLQMQVAPTGSLWESLDEWILPHFATSLVIRMPTRVGRDGKQVGEPSEPLSLEKAGVVMIPGCDALAELILHSDSHRLLVFSGPLRVHNETDLPILLRLHDSVQREVLLVDVPSTSTCDAGILGMPMPDCKVCSELEIDARLADDVRSAVGDQGVGDGTVFISPSAICAVPAFALMQRRSAASSASAASPRVFISVRPLVPGVGFTTAFEVGAGIGRQTVVAGPSDPGSAAETDDKRNQKVHLIIEAQEPLARSGLNFEQWPVTTVVLRPPLVVFNAVPIAGLIFGFSQRVEDRPWKSHLELERFSRTNIYSFSGSIGDGLLVYIQLGVGDATTERDGGDKGSNNRWTSPVRLQNEDFEASRKSRHVLQLCNLQGGAGIVLEALRPVELRLSSPHWLVDRSGISQPLKLELHRFGGILPQAGGITLLPADSLEETCDLVFCSKCSVFASRPFSIPPSWNIFPWRTPCGFFVFCVQTDDIAPSDIFGASSQVSVLRPRLVLTNSSSSDIEVLIGEGRITRLAEGQSQEAHWQVSAGEEDLLTIAIRFRPMRTPSLQWSGTLLCSDAAAGSTPILLQPAEEPGLLQVESIMSEEGEVWSADVAPARGALAVSFRQGSDFVAANRASRTKVSMKIMPQGMLREPEANGPPEIVVPHGGREVPFGWTSPFRGHHEESQERAVNIIVNQRHVLIEDVRRTMCKPIKRLGIAVVVTRRGRQTLVSVEDYDGHMGQVGEPQLPASATGSGAAVASNGQVDVASLWLLRIEVKLTQVVVALTEELPVSRELFTADFRSLQFEWRQYVDDVQQLKLSISKVRVTCHLFTGIGGASSTSGSPEEQQQMLILVNSMGKDRPSSDCPFLALSVQRAATSTTDWLLPYVELRMDALNVAIDDLWLEPLLNFLANCGFDAKKASSTKLKNLVDTAGTAIVEAYVLPPMPFVVQVDTLQISEVSLRVWCSLSLSSSRVLPPYVCAAIRVLSLSGQLTLDGVSLRLPPRRLPAHRGSLSDFVHGLLSEYAADLIDNAAKALGKSSVLSLPSVPLKLGFTVLRASLPAFSIASRLWSKRCAS